MACLNDLNQHSRIQKNALIGRFFIPALLTLFCLISFAKEIPRNYCVSTHFHEKVKLDYVVDGDTIVLKDKRHIRLIGINTPELSHNKKPSEQGALKAKQALSKILKGHNSIMLRYGQVRLDRHGRTLAHLYLNDGTNVQAHLLTSGLAMPLRIPPNLSLADCYNQSSQYAKSHDLGLWALSRYKTHDVANLKGHENGFYIIKGDVRQVTKSRSSVWINMDNKLSLKIKNNDLKYFDKLDLDALQGKMIQASGWLYKHRGQPRMRIRHKLDLTNVSKQ